MSSVDQPSLFSAADWPPGSPRLPTKTLQISCRALQTWKQRIFEFQQQIKIQPPPQQGTLFGGTEVGGIGFGGAGFEGAGFEGIEGDRFPSTPDPNGIDPFKLPQQNTEFWRWKAEDAGVAALYFVIDYQLPLLLYVGETIKSNQRWKGVHDCKRYLLNYVAAHRSHHIPVKVNIGFWAQAPVQTRLRQQLELALIDRWRSPFNKENWEFWNTPFVGEK